MTNEELLQAVRKELSEMETRFDRKLAETEDRAVSRAVEQATRNMRVLIESDINPKMNLILEGIQAINQRLDATPTREEHDGLEDRVSLLENVVGRHSRELANMKAQ